MLSRREFLGSVGAAVLVAGFDPLGRRWLDSAEAATCPGFLNAPALDGVLLLDLASRNADATDKGNIVHRLPAAVLRPGSVRDIQEMVRFCRRCDIPVAARGQHHTMHGQGLTSGLIIETAGMNKIHSITADAADIDAGALWTDVMLAAFDRGLKRPGLTGYTRLSVGGTLSVGGCPLTNDTGALVDTVRELTIVTGRGDVVRCSAQHERDLFEAALGGLGQCGIIVRATVDLVPALPQVRTYLLHYTDTATFFRDFRTLVRRGELDEIYNVCIPPGSSKFVYQINAAAFFDPAAPPDDAHLMRGLSLPPQAAVATDQSYPDYARFVDRQIAVLQVARQWDSLVKPWFDVWLPETTVEPYVGQVLSELTPEDVGPSGFILLFAQRRSKLTRPFFRMPKPDGHDWVYLFDVLPDSALPGPDPAFADRMLARNRRLFDQARAVGGVRYPIGALEFDRSDWVHHYGELWGEFSKRKKRYDPAGILTPGPGIFT